MKPTKTNNLSTFLPVSYRLILCNDLIQFLVLTSSCVVKDGQCTMLMCNTTDGVGIRDDSADVTCRRHGNQQLASFLLPKL